MESHRCGCGKARRWAARVAPGISLLLASTAGLSSSLAQDRVRDFSQPIVTLRVEGHYAPVQALVFPEADGSKMLSAARDKVIQEWEFAAGAVRLTRTLRPPVWRGPRGQILAMALSPRAEVGGERLLAVAGYGLEDNRGNVTLLRYPARDEPNGAVHAHLTSGTGEGVKAVGHVDTVQCLAFDPRGRYLASGAGKLDKTVKIWDLTNGKVLATLPHGDEVRQLAFFDRGRRLATATGGTEGAVRIWNTELPWAVPEPLLRRDLPPPARGDAAGAAINALAVTPDGRWIVVGREVGQLVRLDVMDQLKPRGINNLNLREDQHGAVEAVAISPDGTWVAASVVAKQIPTASDLPSTDCVILLRRLLDDASKMTPAIRFPNLCHALAFSPDGKRLVASGGESQEFVMVEPDLPPRPILKWGEASRGGNGASVRDVGWTADGSTVAVARAPRGPLVANVSYEGFDLKGRSPRPLTRADVREAPPEPSGWSVQPVDPFHLDLKLKGVVQRRIALDPNKLRWWSYALIPPDPARKLHPRTLLAVGAETAITLYDVATGEPTRVFAGHFGPVYALAPSPDGRFLASGSADQTARLWSLAEADRPPKLGATFRPGDAGGLTVATVVKESYAEAMGLEAGDEVLAAWIDNQPVKDLKELPALADSRKPDVSVRLSISRKLDVLGWKLSQKADFATTCRESPALTLFLSGDGEWALWSPRGYYDSSADGDLKYLGWHINGQQSLFRPRPTEFRRMLDYAARFRQLKSDPRNRIDAILDTGRPAEAFLAELPRDRPADLVNKHSPPPPEQKLVAGAANVGLQEIGRPPLGPGETIGKKVYKPVMPVGQAGLRPTIVLADLQKAGTRIAYWINGHQVRPLDAAAPPRDQTVNVALPLVDGANHVVREVVGAGGFRRVDDFDVDVPSVGEPAPEAKLWLVTLAPQYREIPEFRLGPDDALEFRSFLPKHLVSRSALRLTPAGSGLPEDGTVDGLRKRLGELAGRKYGVEDLVVVVVEAHMLDMGGGRGLGLALAKSRAVAGEGPSPVVAASELTEALASAAKSCAVLLLIDGRDAKGPAGADPDIDTWARKLCNEHGVSVLSATEGPPSRVAEDHRRFAQEIFDLPGASSEEARHPKGILSLEDFGQLVKKNTRDHTKSHQRAQFYRSETVDPRVPLFVRSAKTLLVREPGGPSVAR